MTTKDRLKAFLAHKGLSQGKFEKAVGLSNGFVNNIGDSIRTENLQKISDRFPELNSVWLLTGAGDMLHSGKLIEYDVAAGVRKIEALSEIMLSAVSEILAKNQNRPATVVREELNNLVNKRLGH